MQKEIAVSTSKREEMIDITSQVNKVMEESNAKNGLCNVFSTHTTCSIIINENYDPNICTDILNYLRSEAPKGKWLHDKVDENADAHIKVCLLGSSETIPFKDGKMQLGRWQAIQLVELDGPRERKIIVSVMKED